jgi:hypothetical protein
VFLCEYSYGASGKLTVAGSKDCCSRITTWPKMLRLDVFGRYQPSCLGEASRSPTSELSCLSNPFGLVVPIMRVLHKRDESISIVLDTCTVMSPAAQSTLFCLCTNNFHDQRNSSPTITSAFGATLIRTFGVYTNVLILWGSDDVSGRCFPPNPWWWGIQVGLALGPPLYWRITPLTTPETTCMN